MPCSAGSSRGSEFWSSCWGSASARSSFPPGKRWHKAADQNGAAIIRIQGKRYPVTLKRVQESALEENLKKAAAGKYQNVPSGEGGVWFFRLEPRAGESSGADLGALSPREST